MQFVTSLSLIAVLLACPHVCRWQGRMAAAGTGESQSAPVCPCCPKGNGQSPSRHGPSNDGAPPSDCICKGALSVAAADTAMLDIEKAIGWLTPSVTLGDVAEANVDLSFFDATIGHSSAASGRAMRLLMASLRF